MFVQYNRSGQHDNEKDEWLSDKENRHWARAASWRTPGSNNVIRHQQAMIYSIALLDICDFEGIGRKMPKGTGVDASINDGTLAPKHKVRKRSTGRTKGKENKKPKGGKKSGIALAIALGSVREAKLSALRLFLEFGSANEKLKAKQELHSIAYGVAHPAEQTATSTGEVVDTSSTTSGSDNDDVDDASSSSSSDSVGN
jgi:hypothetical protein